MVTAALMVLAVINGLVLVYFVAVNLVYMITSAKAVFQSPAVMLCWGAAVGGMTLLAIAPAFLGVIVVFPILGHTTWHLFDRLVTRA